MFFTYKNIMLKAANNSYFVSRHVKKYLGSSPIKQVGCKTVIIILKHFVLNIEKALIILVSAFLFYIKLFKEAYRI